MKKDHNECIKKEEELVKEVKEELVVDFMALENKMRLLIDDP